MEYLVYREWNYVIIVFSIMKKIQEDEWKEFYGNYLWGLLSVPQTSGYFGKALIFEPSDSDVAKVDEDGAVSAGVYGSTVITTITQDGAVAAKTNVTVYSDTIYKTSFESFENNIFDGWETLDTTSNPTQVCQSADYSHSGSNSFAPASKTKRALIRKYFTDTGYNKVVSMWYYDDGTSAQARTVARVENASSGAPFIGIGLFGSISGNYYCVWDSTADKTVGTTLSNGQVIATSDTEKQWMASVCMGL